MTFQAIRALGQEGMAAHVIVNGWENFRITPLAEAAGASWSVGPYWHPLTRHRLTPMTIARMAIEVIRVSVNLLAVSRRVDPTHVLLPDSQTVLRNSLALAWLRLRGVRVMVRLGNAPEPGRFYKILWRFMVNPFVDMFVANSDFTRRELLAHGVRPEKVVTIPNVPWRDVEAAGPDTPRVAGRVVFVGQIIPEKGLLLLLDAIARLRASGVESTLDVVGDMDGWESPSYRGYRARIRAWVEQPDLAGAVRLLGWRGDTLEIMRSASVHCCPSLAEQREAFGIVVLEAKLTSLPSVVTPSGNLPALVAHKHDGWVCDRFDVDAVVEGLAFFLTQPETLAAAGKAARRSADQFTRERFEDAWARVAFSEEKAQAHALP